MPDIERDLTVYKAANPITVSSDDDPPGGSGWACRYGNMDRNGDVIFAGVFSDEVVNSFFADGSVLDGHWGPQIGTVDAVEDKSEGLYSSWLYHSTADAMACFTKAKERIERGKTVALSIGFRVHPGGFTPFESGAALANYARRMGLEYDEDSVMSWTRECYAILPGAGKEIFEYSQVSTPANPKAIADRVKTLLGGSGAFAGLSCESHIDAALSAVEGAIHRLKSAADQRAIDSRTLSLDRVKQCRELAVVLNDLADSVKTAKSADELALRGRALLLTLVD